MLLCIKITFNRVLQMQKLFNRAIMKFIEAFNKLINDRYSLHEQAMAVAVGTYIAFSPFIGLHTLLTIFLAWLFRLNCPVMIAVSWIINNPWTMIPLYLFDYWIGSKIVYLMGIELKNPTWMERINTFLQSYCPNQELSIWAFLIGGNVVGIIAGIAIYPIILYSMKRFSKRFLS
jgi:uncharacterized protein